MANEFVIKNGYFSQGNSNITGSLIVTGGVTASLQGTASYAITASYAMNAGGSAIDTGSFVTTSSFNTYTGSAASQFAGTASFAITSSYYAETDPVFVSVSGSFTTTSSFNAFTSSYTTGSFTGSFIGDGSGLIGVISSSYSVSSSYALSSSYAESSSYAISASYSETASLAVTSLNASDVLLYVKNTTGNTIDKGTVVRISGATGDNALIATASYTDDGNSANTLGILNETIADQAFGYAMTEGKLLGISTDAFTAGQLLYLGPTGSIIGYAPVAPLHAVRLGQALRIQQNNGSMYVRIDNGYEIDELHNVLIISGSDGDLLVASGSSFNGNKLYINSKQLTGSYGLTGSLNVSGSVSVYVDTVSNTNFTAALIGSASGYQSTSSYESVGVYGYSAGNNIANVGGYFFVQDGSGSNYGISVESAGDPYGNTALSIGGFFGVSAAQSNYSVQLIDGTQGLNKVLTSVTSDGKANWSDTINVTSVTASFTGSLIGSLTGTSSYAAESKLLDGNDKAVFATTGSNIFKSSQIITGSLTITNDLVVLGSSSIQYITSSQLDITTNIISVNTYNPAVRFGGLAVIDSGSSPIQSGSLLFDSQNNQWIYVHQAAAGADITSSVLIMGPQTFNNIGNETTITANRLTKGTGGDLGEHIGDSNITDTGTTVSINSNTEITGSVKITNSLTVGGTIIGNGGMSMSGSNSVTGSMIITGSTSTDLVRITQTGTGNAFVVEDSTNPDATPFVIGSNGNVGIGVAPAGTAALSINTTNQFGISSQATTVGIDGIGATAGVQGSSNGGAGVYGIGYDAATMIGVEGYTDYSEGTGVLSIGGKFTARLSTNNYALQLIDGTETVAGRFLINQTTDGKANWGKTIPDIQITNAITGSTGNNTGTDAMIQASLLYLSNNC